MLSYELGRASVDTAIAVVQIQGGKPEVRGFGHISVLNTEELMIYGGVYTAVDDSGVGVKRVGYGDAWDYKYSPQLRLALS